MAIGKKTGGRDWIKGQSGNPDGRPKSGEALNDILHEIVDKQELAKLLWKKAKFDNNTLRYLCDRVGGKPTEAIQIIETPEIIWYQNGSTDTENSTTTEKQ